MTPLSSKTTDIHVKGLKPLIPPAVLQQEIPLAPGEARRIAEQRRAIARALKGKDDRLVVIVGPCSIHDPKAALEYASRLRRLSLRLEGELLIVMRVYFEKPRTTVGWKGLINDPRLDGTCAINEGLRVARRLLVEIVSLGLPAGCEFLDPISPQFITDLVAWGAIGARTTESQVHRELASGLSMPVGFKNGTNGSIRIAIEGVVAARHPHRFLGVSEQGMASIVETSGNPDCHIILRGGESGPNYSAGSVRHCREQLSKEKLPPRLMIDVSHGNSGKDHRRQPEVIRELCERISAGEEGIFGVMMESFLAEGRQDLKPGVPPRYGQSITDACMSWETTAEVLKDLARALRTGRRKGG